MPNFPAVVDIFMTTCMHMWCRLMHHHPFLWIFWWCHQFNCFAFYLDQMYFKCERTTPVIVSTKFGA